MRPLDRKLFRDILAIKGQAISIGVVIGLAVMALVVMTCLESSLSKTKTEYYEKYHFADAFVSFVQAPSSIVESAKKIEGVNYAEGRIVGDASLQLEGSSSPIPTRAVSVPDGYSLNSLVIMRGNKIQSGQNNSVLLLKDFAEAWGINPEDTINVTIKGIQRKFRVAGLAESPEFIYTVAPGEIAPDKKRVAVIWMSKPTMEIAYNLNNAINEIALTTVHSDTYSPDILKKLNKLLKPYGGTGAYFRNDQPSNKMIEDEIEGLRGSSTSVPTILLTIASFLLYVVINRLVQSERRQIGILKAFGLTNFEIGSHYLKLTLLISLCGSLFGSLLGLVLVRNMLSSYHDFYNFPFLLFDLNIAKLIGGILVSVVSASLGGFIVIRKISKLLPVESMSPSPPPNYARTGRFGKNILEGIDQQSRMVLRRVTRFPRRILGAVIAIACGMALNVSMLGVFAGFEKTMVMSFFVSDRSDATITFVKELEKTTVVNDLLSYSEIQQVEGARTLPVIFSHGLHSYEATLYGMDTSTSLNRLVDKIGNQIEMPKRGVIIGKVLAEKLSVDVGDIVNVVVRTGSRSSFQIPITQIVNTHFGVPAYMDLNTLNNTLHEPDIISNVYVSLDPKQNNNIYNKLIGESHLISGISVKSEARESFQNLMNSGTGKTRYMMAIIAFAITCGVTYSLARIALAESERDLASLRVLGFTRGEVALILLGEFEIIILLALMLGGLFGYFLTGVVARAFSVDTFQIPVVFSINSYGVAMLVVILAASISAYLIWYKIARSDIMQSLRSRE